jgi:hypothetical protein
MCGGTGEKGMLRVGQRAEKRGQLILNMGLAQAEVRILVQRTTTPNKRFFFYAD